jgi:hypothetical protein
MDIDKKFLGKMKILINTVAFIAFIGQFFSFAFSAINQKKPESAIESVYNYYIFFAFLCSLITVVIFVVEYNFNFKLLKKKIPNYIFLVIVALGIYIAVMQLLALNDFLLTSCILLLFDYYIMRKILSNLFSSSDTNLE